MKRLFILAVLACALIATPAMAKEGGYLGVGLFYANMTDNDLEFLDPSIGGELRVGYSFGSIAVEGNLIKSTHDDTDPGFDDADFTGLSIDVRFSFSQLEDPNQFYFLAGLGSYEIDGDGYELDKSGFNGLNLGVGLEHWFNEQVALDIRGVLRIIEYDLPSFGDVDGDTFTLGVGINFHL